MRRLISRVVLCLFVYFISVFVLGRTFDAVANLLAKAGSPELWTVLHQHPFGRGILIGLLAGLMPLDFWLSVSGFFSADISEFLRKLELEQMKKWVVVLFSPFMVAVLGEWIIDWHKMHSKQLTVLSKSSSMPISTIFEGFFSTSCRNVSDVRLDMWGDNFQYQCSLHILWVSVLLMTAGYSLAPWIRARLQPTQMTEHEESIVDFSGDNDPESKTTERTEER
jgi:hypothetical protein